MCDEVINDSQKQADGTGSGHGSEGQVVLGSLDGISGPGAAACAGYVSTRHEVLELARYWMTEAMDAQIPGCFNEQAGRVRSYGSGRLDHMADVLGQRALNGISAEVEGDFRKRLGDGRWEAFLSANDQERDTIGIEMCSAWERRAGPPGYAVDHLGREAVRTFPEMPGKELANGLRIAADAVESGHVHIAPCDHDWQTDPKKPSRRRTAGGAISVFDCCGRCDAIRERVICPGGSDAETRGEGGQEGAKPSEDSEGLHAWGSDRYVIGSVDEVNGPEASPCPEYVPTRHEVLQLARYWSARWMDIEMSYFFTSAVGSSDWRVHAYAGRRLDRMAEAIGLEAVDKVFGEIREKCREDMDVRHWQIYQSGTDEERTKLVEEMCADTDEEMSQDAETVAPADAAPFYVVDCLGKQAVSALPELPVAEVAAALRLAAESVEAGHFEAPACDHDWQRDLERLPVRDGFIFGSSD